MLSKGRFLKYPAVFKEDGTLDSGGVVALGKSKQIEDRLEEFLSLRQRSMSVMIGGAFLTVGEVLFFYGCLSREVVKRGKVLIEDEKTPSIKTLETAIKEAVTKEHYAILTFDHYGPIGVITVQLWRQSRHTSGHPYGVVMEFPMSKGTWFPIKTKGWT